MTETRSTASVSGPPQAIDLVSGDTTASVRMQGAELSRWACGGRELLWSGDPTWWARISPLLFPVVGHLRGGLAWFAGLPQRMPTHGFAGTSSFVVRDRSADRVTLALCSDEHTRVAFPFEFELRVQYRLASNGIGIELRLRNKGHTPMPYSIGLHPGFRWPWGAGGADGHSIVFSADESAHVPVISKEGLFTTSTRPLPFEGRRLPLTSSLLANQALCFIGARSRALAFEAPDGSAIEFERHGFAHWAIWCPAGAPLLSIEAWTGHGDAIDFEGEFEARPSTLKLAPRHVARHGLRLRYRAADGNA